MSKEQTVKFFSASDVRSALPMSAAVDAMKTVFLEVSSGEACVPARTHIEISEQKGDALFMPSYSKSLGRMGLKVVTLHPDNPAIDLPFIQGVVLLLDAATGSTMAVMNGTVLTQIRTGAASGAGTDLLARPDAARVAVFGAGVQACTQLEAVCAVREIEHANVFDISDERARTFAARMTEALDIEITPCKTSQETLADADIVCTATTATTPVFPDEALAPGTHINAIGAYKPHVREIPPETVVRAKVVVDQYESAWEEAGDLIMPLKDGLIDDSHIHAELGEIIAGKRAGRENDDEITFFKSVGVATQDLAAASKVYERAVAEGFGTEVKM